MKVEKRNNYIQNLYCALHTIQIKTFDEINADVSEREAAIKSFQKRKVKGEDCYYYTIQLNLNKGRLGGTMITRYSDFKAELEDLLARIGIERYTITRADLCINSDDREDYERFKKLNRLILCGLSEAYKIDNCYVSSDLWTFKSLNTAIKGNAIEAENYDKFIESKGTVPTCNRLELRSKGIKNISLQDEFMVRWFERLDRAIEFFLDVQERYYNILIERWYEDLSKPVKERDYMNLTAFIMAHKDSIFTMSQLEDLIYQCDGRKNHEQAKKQAKNLKDRYSIEFYSMKDLTIVCDGIKSKITEYFAR